MQRSAWLAPNTLPYMKLGLTVKTGKTAEKFKARARSISWGDQKKCHRLKSKGITPMISSVAGNNWKENLIAFLLLLETISLDSSISRIKGRCWQQGKDGNHMKSEVVFVGDGERETGFSCAPVAEASPSAPILPTAFQSLFPPMPRQSKGRCNDFMFSQK